MEWSLTLRGSRGSLKLLIALGRLSFSIASSTMNVSGIRKFNTRTGRYLDFGCFP